MTLTLRNCFTIFFSVLALSAFGQSTTEINALAFKAYHSSDKDPRGAFKMLEAESKKPGFQNADSARIIFAAFHQTGIGTLPDSKKAMEIWKEEADKGSSWAATFLSIEYATKAYLNKKEKADCFRYTELAAKDHLFSKYRLGLFYYSGKYVKKDKQKGVELLKSAAMDGEPHACIQVGNMYKYGTNVDLSKSTAFELYQKAAEQDHAPAYIKLFTCYKEGIGTKQSYSKAIEMLEKGIKAGDAEALYQMGEAYRLGECGMQENEDQAQRYLKRAADQNHTRAAQTLALMNQPPPVTVVEVPVQSSNGQAATADQPMTYNEAIAAYKSDLRDRGWDLENEGGVDAGGAYKFDGGGLLYGKVKIILIVNEGTRPGYYPTFKSTFFDSKNNSLGYFTSGTSEITRLSNHLTAVSVVLDVPNYASYLRVAPRASGYLLFAND